MRILMISDVYFPRVNGVSTSIQTLATELSEKGHEITLIAPDYASAMARPADLRSRFRQFGDAHGGSPFGYPPYNSGADGPRVGWSLRKGRPVSAASPQGDVSARESDSFEIIRIPSRYLPVDPEDRILRKGEIRKLGPQLAERSYDLVHIQTPFIAHYAGLRLARRLVLPVIASYHTFFEQYLDKYVSFLPSSWLRLAARRFSAAQCGDVDALAVPSRAMLSILRAYGVTTPAAVVPTGIELGQFARGDGGRFRWRHAIPADRPVLVHVGRLAFEKNVDFLLRMLVRVRREIPNVLLAIAGEGPARRSLESLGAELGLQENLLFVGYLSRDGALEDCYCAGDAFVFASRTETQGLVLLEAMALGVPVVSTAVMGTKEVLDGGKGSLIAADDETDFASKAVHLLSDPDLRATLSEQARAYARTWSAPELADRMLDLYRTVAVGTEPQGELRQSEV